LTTFDEFNAKGALANQRTGENRTGIHDPAHFAYSTYAKATIGRRDNLKRTIGRPKEQLPIDQGAVVEASED
jgi:flagellar protein FliJ